jgi:hypothetical protein
MIGRRRKRTMPADGPHPLAQSHRELINMWPLGEMVAASGASLGSSGILPRPALAAANHFAAAPMFW